MVSAKKQKNSPLRSIIRRLFGKKDKSKTTISPPSSLEPTRNKSTVVGPPGQRDHGQVNEGAKGSQHSPSLCSLESEPPNPLRSHLPFPMNVNAPADVSPPVGYLTVGPPPKVHRRRATLPSIVISPTDVGALNAVWEGSSARMIAYNEEKSTQPPARPTVGLAETSPTLLKRRSRSAGALWDLAREQEQAAGDRRRRSAEIKLWRASTSRTSINASNSQDVVPKKDAEYSSANVPHMANIHTVEHPVSSPTHDEPGAFARERLQADAPNSEGTMSGLRALSGFEARLSRLEENMRGVESSLQKLTGRSHRQTIILESTPSTRHTRHHDSDPFREPSSAEAESGGHGPSQPALSMPTSPSRRPAFVASPSSKSLTKSAVSNGPASFSRRPATSVMQPISPNVLRTHPQPIETRAYRLADDQEALVVALQRERRRRKSLEAQLRLSQQEVQDLRSLVYSREASIKPSNAYSTSKPHHSPTEFKGDTDRRQTTISRFSQYDSGDEGECASESGSSTRTQAWSAEWARKETVAPELWQTPREEMAAHDFRGTDQSTMF